MPHQEDTTTPTRRIRTKTSDITGFFRGTNASKLNVASSSTSVPPPLPDAPTLKKKRSRIPFMGPKSSRKLQDAALDTPPASPSRASRSGPPAQPILPPLAVSQTPSLGSKFAAHFAPHMNRSSRASQVTPTVVQQHTMSPTSFDSVRSSMSQSRSRPIITVSVPQPEHVESYRHSIFTVPRAAPLPPSESHPAIPHFEGKVVETPSISTRTSVTSETVGKRTGSSIAPAAGSSATRRTPERPAPLKPTPRHKVHSISVVRHLEDVLGTAVVAGDLDDPGEGAKTAKRSSPPSPKSPRNSPPLVRKTTTSFGRSGNSSPPSTAPPTIPLPIPPPRPNKLSISPASSISRRTSAVTVAEDVRRPRANTFSAARTNPSSSSPTTASSLRCRSKVSGSTDEEKSDKENVASIRRVSPDRLRNATPEQLRQALAAEKKRADVIAASMVAAVESHVKEKTFLEDKIEALENEARKRERELQGLRWLVMNGHGGASPPKPAPSLPPSPPGSRPLASTASPPPNSAASLELELSMNGFNLRTLELPRRLSREALKLGASANSPSIKLSRATTIPHQENHGSPKPSRSSNIPPSAEKVGLGLDFPNMTFPNHRTSMSSLASTSTSTSSSSNYSVPGLTASNTVSSVLSAIPETPSSPSSPSNDLVGVIEAAMMMEAEEHRGARKRINTTSTSSSKSSLQVAPAAAVNIKRPRPRSFGQAMDQSPIVDEMLNQLRPFVDSP